MNKAISFFIGLLTGIMICVLLFYFDVKFFEAKCPKCNEKEVTTIVLTDTLYVESLQKPKKQYAAINLFEEAVTENGEDEQSEIENSIYETEFSLDGVEQDEVFSDQLLHTKTVKVRLHPQGKQEINLPDNFFQYFEIQLWSTPIKNKITYYRDKNMIKIKGMDISNVAIVFWNDSYFLETGNHYYAIPETQYFEKLNLIHIP
jgi:phage FluMu protein Com